MYSFRNSLFQLHTQKTQRGGFTLIELLVVIAILGILTTVVLSSIPDAKEATYSARAKTEVRQVREALELYAIENNGAYPADVARDLPPGLEKYLSSDEWPEAPWPGSVYDWDNWTDPDTGEKIYQISIRFCDQGDPSSCNFPDEEWAENFDVNSAVYFCVQGPCRSHISEPPDHPGRCLNC